MDRVSFTRERYLVYVCDEICGGWADRLKGILSTYMMANLTKRQFKVQIKRPWCDLKNYLVPNKVNWTIADDFTYEKNLTIKQTDTRFINMVHKRPYDLTGRTDQTNFYDTFREHIRHYFTRTNMDYISGMRNSCIYNQELSWTHDVNIADIYAALYKRLFKLAPRLETVLQNTLSENLPTPNHRLICVHVRLGHEAFDTDWAKRNSIENLPEVWRFIRNHSQSDFDKVFVMSDSEKVIDIARNQSFGQRVFSIPGHIVHIDKFDLHRQSTTRACKGFQRLLLEHHMLMNCDLLMTSHSGLSNFASFIRGTDDGLFCLRDDGYIEPCERNDLRHFANVRKH